MRGFQVCSAKLCRIIIKRATRNSWDYLKNAKLCVLFFKRSKAERSWFHTEWSHCHALFLKLHGSRQQICCLEKFHRRRDHIAGRSLMQKPWKWKEKNPTHTNICKYIQIFVNTKSLTPVGCWNIGHCPCGLRLETSPPHGLQHPSGVDCTRRGN